MSKNNIYRRGIAGLLAGIVAIPNLLSAPASAEETEKYQYNLFGRNGIELTADNFCTNGNWHTNKSVSVSCVNRNFNGTLTTEADIVKRVKHVYADQKIYNTYFTDNCELLEEEYSYTDLNININSPLFCYGNINLNGNVSLNSNLGTLMNLNITGEVKNANNSVVYSKYGNITIENNSTANINGLIYAPLGTLTINSPNVNINGIVIADKVVINGNCVNINNNDNIARFVGNISEAYDFSGLEYLPEEWLGDTDEDGLFDIYEKVIDSDPLDADTDDDGLPDGYEVLTLGTDPLEVDTDENGISDAEEDFDSDNLNNLDEYINNTQPFNPDTDEDGFMDGSEVYTYGTDPLNPDTDNDGLLDGEESYDGSIYTNYGVYFDPLNPDTNGNGILDGNEVFGQSKQQKVETYDDAITEVNVEMDTNGNLERNLTIESMYGIDAMSSNVHAIIGEPFNFTSSTSFESATISFKVDQSKLGDTDFDNLIILWYNEEDQRFEEMPTTRDAVNSTVSTTTTHFSQYMVVDSVKWYENWERSLDRLRTMWVGGTSYRKCVHTIFLIDCSASMNNSDKISYSIEIGYNGVTEDNYMSIINDMDSPSDVEYNLKTYGKRSCNRTRIPENVIANKGKTDCAKIITFSDDVEEDSGFSLYSPWLNKFIQKVNSNGTNANLDNAISQAFNNVVTDSVDRYRFVVLTDRNINVTNSVLNHNWNNSELIFVNLGNLTFGAMVDYLANATGGTTYDAISADSLAYESGEMIYTPEQYIGEDSDGDSIPDIVELYGLKPNGEPIGTNPYSKDTDGDTIPDNIELHYTGEKLSSGMNMAQFVTSMYCESDPTKNDSDNDGLDDTLDNAPLNSNEHCFLIYETEYTDEELHSYKGGNEGPKDYRYSDMTKSELRNLKYINWSDFIGFTNEFEEYIKCVAKCFAWDDMDDVVVDMFDYFFSGKGGNYSNPILTSHAQSHPSSKDYKESTIKLINEYINVHNGDIKGLKYYVNNRESSYMVSKMIQSQISPPTYEDIVGGLGICVDGTYGNQIELTSYKIENNNYEYKIRYTIYDIFGLDDNDIEGSGRLVSFGALSMFRYWYILQHYDKYDGDYKPFITYIVFEETISGVLK